MSKLKHLAFPLLILCLSTIFIGCGVGKRRAEQSSSEMEDVREVGVDAKADLLVFAPDGKLIGKIHLPETCANLCFGGAKKNRLFMAASQSLYAVYVETQGAQLP